MPQRKKRGYQTDAEGGIRHLNVIKQLPVLELTDEEHVKVFMDRFEARAILMHYTDKDNGWHWFGRIKGGKQAQEDYDRLLERVKAFFRDDLIQFYFSMVLDPPDQNNP